MNEIYQCDLCDRWFRKQDAPLTASCCIIHEPGECCHFQEVEIDNPGGRPTDKIGGRKMERVKMGTSKFTEILVLDAPGPGNAYHEYEVQDIKPTKNPETGEEVYKTYANISFQYGPIGISGVNGIHQEDLLNIVLHRLQSFQSGDFRCRENAIAITKVEEALMWLNKRTQARIDKGIEGTNVNHE